MLFCFGLFALLLYYTVVANAECSYTYRNSSSPQHIDAQSSVLAQQGFQRCEFLIQLVSQQQQLQLNFTRLSGFALLPSAPSTHSHGQQEGQGKEEEEEEEGREGRGEGGGHPQRQGLLTPGETDKGVEGSPASSVLSSPPGMKDTAAKNTTARTVYAKANHRTVSERAPLMTSTTTAAGTLAGRGRSCLPMVEIRTVVGRDGKEELEHRICGQHHPTQTPIVFHYASSVRIVYEWDLEHSSGFTLYFGFSASDKEKCVHTCDGTRCLREAAQLCDGRDDCLDRSDERSPACSLSPATSIPQSLSAESLVLVTVIPSCVIVLAVLSAVCLLGRRRCSPASGGTMHRANGHATHLACPQSHSSEGLSPSACSTQECNEQVVALLPNSYRSHKSWRASSRVPSHPHPHPPHQAPPPPHLTPDPQIDLPPNIPVSPDGEEGYVASQLGLLHPRYHSAQSELFKPPPNKTVFDRDSPPPYSITPPLGTHGCGSAPTCVYPAALRQSREPLGHARVVRDSDGEAVVSRCYGVSPSADHSQSQAALQQDPGGCCSGNDLAAQRSSHIHGACRIKDALPSAASAATSFGEGSVGKSLPTSSCSPPLVRVSSSSSGDNVSSSSSPPLPPHSDPDGGAVKGSNFVDLCAAPPSYQLTLSQNRQEEGSGEECRNGATPAAPPFVNSDSAGV